ncbi:MAG: 2Fe-2S iron-sulfur cluster-binding protein [Actinomycetota bacterium]
MRDLQRTFVEMTALQCGACIPGFLEHATALLRLSSNPTEEEVWVWPQSNLCR